MDEESRKKVVVLDVSSIRDVKELHSILKDKLEFPDFYGMNWGAFWDAITRLVELPETLIIKGWECLQHSLPSDSAILKDLLLTCNEECPEWETRVIFE